MLQLAHERVLDSAERRCFARRATDTPLPMKEQMGLAIVVQKRPDRDCFTSLDNVCGTAVFDCKRPSKVSRIIVFLEGTWSGIVLVRGGRLRGNRNVRNIEMSGQCWLRRIPKQS